MPSHLLIDFDNTMMATEQYAVPTLVARFNTLYGDQISAPLTPALFQQHFHGQARDSLCRNLSLHYGIKVDCATLYAGREWDMMQTLQRVAGGITMAEGLVETLRDLKNSRGILACLVSNNPVQRALAAMRYAANGEGEQLAALLGTRLFEADERQKPLPDVYLRALAQTGAAAAEAIAIEDSVTGATSARAAGLRVLGFTGFADEPEKAAQKLRDAGCTAVFHNWRDIQPLLAH